MIDDKQEAIIKELKRRADYVQYGKMIVEFSIHQGKIMAGEIIEQKIKLG